MGKNNPFSEALPIFAICNIEAAPLNPYREFVDFCQKTFYSKFENKIGLSLNEFNKKGEEARTAFRNAIAEALPESRIEDVTPSHPRIFFEFNLYNKDVRLCNLKFYTHLSYVSTGEITDKEQTSAELDFTCSTELDFLKGIKAEENILDFNKSSEDKRSVDMILAHLYGLANFTEFIKHFKTKMLAVKNIEMFCNKLIKPWVVDISVLYTPEVFIIGTLCGDEINKESYPYDGYLVSIKKYAEEIKEKYGDKYKIENELIAEQEKKENQTAVV